MGADQKAAEEQALAGTMLMELERQAQSSDLDVNGSRPLGEVSIEGQVDLYALARAVIRALDEHRQRTTNA